jgi:hypothetical protein
MSLREVLFPGEFQRFQTFCSNTNVLDALGGNEGIFYSFITQLLSHGGLCIRIDLDPINPNSGFVEMVRGGNPALNRVPDRYYAHIFIYLTNNVQVNQDNQPIRDPDFLPPNHIHIYPCEEVSTNEDRTGCKNGGARRSFSTNQQGVTVGWKRKNGNLACGQGALCGILYLSSNLDQLMFTSVSCANDFYAELINPGTHPAYGINIGFTDQNHTFRRTSSPSVSKKGGRKSRKKSPKKGGRKSPKKGGRKSRKKGGRKSRKKGGRKSPKKGKKSVEAKRKSIYRRVLSQRRRKTIAASVDQDPIHVYYEFVRDKFSPVNLITYDDGSATPPDLKHVYILLYNPELLQNPYLAQHLPEATNQLNVTKIYEYLRDSNNDLSNCGHERQKKPEYCGNCVISNNMVSLNLDNKFIGDVVNGRGTCRYEEHSNILWHTHPLTSRPWPSGEDIDKMIKPRPGIENDKIPVVSLIFTKWGIWQIVVPMHSKRIIDKNTVKNISDLGGHLFENIWKQTVNSICFNNYQDEAWRQSIRTNVNSYILTLANNVPQLNPSINGGGFVQFNFWDTIADHDFAYHCYIPKTDISKIR